jgi:hypothetical protein
MDMAVEDYLMDAKSVKFIMPEDNNGIPAVFILFENYNVGGALYSEVIRVNETNPQYMGFKKSHSSLIVSFILEKTGRPHAKMLLDYDEKEFDEFIKALEKDSLYIVLFGQFGENGERQTFAFDRKIFQCSKYLLE